MLLSLFGGKICPRNGMSEKDWLIVFQAAEDQTDGTPRYVPWTKGKKQGGLNGASLKVSRNWS